MGFFVCLCDHSAYPFVLALYICFASQRQKVLFLHADNLHQYRKDDEKIFFSYSRIGSKNFCGATDSSANCLIIMRWQSRQWQDCHLPFSSLCVRSNGSKDFFLHFDMFCTYKLQKSLALQKTSTQNL